MTGMNAEFHVKSWSCHGINEREKSVWYLKLKKLIGYRVEALLKGRVSCGLSETGDFFWWRKGKV